jgi:hypothetical protein
MMSPQFDSYHLDLSAMSDEELFILGHEGEGRRRKGN